MPNPGWYFGGGNRQLPWELQRQGGMDVEAPLPSAPPAPAAPAAAAAPAAPYTGGTTGFVNDPSSGGGAPTGPAAPGGPGPIGNTAEAMSSFPSMSPVDASQAAQAQNTADVNAMNAMANPAGALFGSLTGTNSSLTNAAVGMGAHQALGSISPALGAIAGPAQAAFGVPAAVQAIGTAFGLPTATVGNRSLASDQNDLNAAFPTINPFAVQQADVAPSSANAFDAPTGTPGTSGTNSAGQSVGFGAPGTAGAGVAGGFSSAFGGSGAGGALGGTNFGGVGNTTGPAAAYSGIEGEAPGPGTGGGPGPGPAGAGPGGAGEAGDSGGGSSGDGPSEKRGGLIGKRQPGQRPDPKMLASKLKTGGGTVSQGSKKPGADDVPVRLSKGEFVEPKQTVDQFGPLLEKLRQHGLRGGMNVGMQR